MDKRQVVWLIIRLVGVYFAYLTLVTLFSLLGSLSFLFSSTPGGTPNANTNTNMQVIRVQPINPGFGTNTAIDGAATPSAETEAEKEAKSAAIKLFLWYVLLTAIYGALAWYLLRDGRFLFAVLMREEPSKSREVVPEVTSLNLSDKQN